MKLPVPILILAFTILNAPAKIATLASDGQSTLLNKKLSRAKSDKIFRIEVFSIPKDAESPISISSERLERAYWTKTTVKGFQYRKCRSELLSALDQSEILKAPHVGRDLRWGCVFYNEKGERVLSIYFNRFGDGQVDDMTVSSNGKLLNYLEKQFTIP